MLKSLYSIVLVYVLMGCSGLNSDSINPVKIGQVKAKWIAKLEQEERELCAEISISVEAVPEKRLQMLQL